MGQMSSVLGRGRAPPLRSRSSINKKLKHTKTTNARAPAVKKDQAKRRVRREVGEIMILVMKKLHDYLWQISQYLLTLKLSFLKLIQ